MNNNKERKKTILEMMKKCKTNFLSSHNKFIIIAVAAESSADFYKGFSYNVPSRTATASAEEHSNSRSSSRRMVGDTNQHTHMHTYIITQKLK